MTIWFAVTVCLSLANLFHLLRWHRILEAPLFQLADRSALLISVRVLLASIAIMAVLGFAIFMLSRRFPVLRLLTRWGCFIVLSVSLAIALGLADPALRDSPSSPLLLGAILAFACAALAWHRWPAFRRAVCTATAAGAFALPVFVAQTIPIAGHWTSRPIPSAGPVPGKPAILPNSPTGSRPSPQRIVWILFDELDQYLTFEVPGSAVLYPEFNRMQAQSFHSGAVVPAHYFTGAAVPSMLNGTPLLRTQTEAGKGAAERVWDSPSDLFRILQLNGGSAAILASSLRYCQLVGVYLTRCYARAETRSPAHFFRSAREVGRYWRGNVAGLPIAGSAYKAIRESLRGPRHKDVSLPKHRSIEVLDPLSRQLPEYLTGPFDFAYIHWPIPHPPGLWPGRDSNAAPDYLDNLALADVTLGNSRRILEAAGLWDDSIVVVSSDHHYRLNYWKPGRESRMFAATRGEEHRRIPLLIKMPHQTHGIEYTKAFNAVLLHDLMVELATRRIASPDQIAPWLDRNRGRFSVTSIPED